MRRLVSCAICLSFAAMGHSAAPAPQPLSPLARAAAADAAYRAADWAGALPLYERLVREHPDSHVLWLRLAACQQGSAQHAQAIASYENAQAHGAPAGAVQYGIAIARASQGDNAGAFTALSAAVSQGHGRPDLLLTEPALAPLRGEPRFAALVKQAQHNQAPCAARAESRQFDFWVGDWQVLTSTEFLPVGRSHIERTIGDCVIWENWSSLGESGYAGKSYNVYNLEQKRWEQFWVDNQGGMIHFYGQLSGGVMDFYTAAIAQADGKTLKRRLRFYNLGANRVRQFGEGSSDEGKTWTVEYDFTYYREQ